MPRPTNEFCFLLSLDSVRSINIGLFFFWARVCAGRADRCVRPIDGPEGRVRARMAKRSQLFGRSAASSSSPTCAHALARTHVPKAHRKLSPPLKTNVKRVVRAHATVAAAAAARRCLLFRFAQTVLNRDNIGARRARAKRQ